MSDHLTILSEAEIEKLDQFLLDRIDEDEDTIDKDEGVLDISELDGLFTAIVSGPMSIPPSKWLPLVWGDFEPMWDSEKEFKAIFVLMMRHMNVIALTLMEHAEDFEPIFLERVVESKTYTIVDEWCEGYSRGMALVEDQWNAGGQEVAILLIPILAFTSIMNWRGHNFSGNELQNLQNAIIPNVRDIHCFWLAQREQDKQPSAPIRHSKPRLGRNDPCFCGSGKKFKKCCLH